MYLFTTALSELSSSAQQRAQIQISLFPEDFTEEIQGFVLFFVDIPTDQLTSPLSLDHILTHRLSLAVLLEFPHARRGALGDPQ